MDRRYTRSIALGVLCVLAAALAACPVQAGHPRPLLVVPPVVVDPPCLSIGTWNDLHGQIAPDLPVIDTGPIPAGGVIALADSISDLRATADTIMLLDAGDLFTGPLESTLSEGAPVIAAYKLLRVDAVAIGNHEFDFGPVGDRAVTAGDTDAAGARGPRGALMARMASASFPFLSANVHISGGAVPAWPNFAASTHIRRGGFDVGVVGYTTNETPSTTSPPNVADLDFSTHAAESVAAEIRTLRASGAAPIVLLAHASIDGVLPQTLDNPDDPQGDKYEGELAALVAALGKDRPDVIVGGHRHGWMLGRIHGIPMVSSDQHGVGLTRVRFCRPQGAPMLDTPVLESIERLAVLAASPPRTPLGREVLRVVEPWVTAVKTQGATPVTTLMTACPTQAVDGTAAAEQLARGIAAHASDAIEAQSGIPLVAITNAGALRTPLRTGLVTYADVFRALPFESTVAVCRTTRGGLARILRNALRDPSAWKHFPFALAGATATISRAADGTLSLLGLTVHGDSRPVSDESPISLAMPDFLLDGGDGLLEGVTCVSSARSATRIRDAWRELLAREAGCDGRPKSVIIRASR